MSGAPRIAIPAPLQMAVSCAQKAQVIWDARRKDFWNHPKLWDDIEDPTTEMCWDHRLKDVIDVRSSQ